LNQLDLKRREEELDRRETYIKKKEQELINSKGKLYDRLNLSVRQLDFIIVAGGIGVFLCIFAGLYFK